MVVKQLVKSLDSCLMSSLRIYHHGQLREYSKERFKIHVWSFVSFTREQYIELTLRNDRSDTTVLHHSFKFGRLEIINVHAISKTSVKAKYKSQLSFDFLNLHVFFALFLNDLCTFICFFEVISHIIARCGRLTRLFLDLISRVELRLLMNGFFLWSSRYHVERGRSDLVFLLSPISLQGKVNRLSILPLCNLLLLLFLASGGLVVVDYLSFRLIKADEVCASH